MRYSELFNSRRLNETTYTAYHGTGAKFDAFHQPTMRPHFFTTDKNYASAYSGGKSYTGFFGGKGKAKNYLLTVEVEISRMFDTKSDEVAREYYNQQFLPYFNRILAKYNKPLAPEITHGEMVHFIYADDLWRYFMQENESKWDGILVDEGSHTVPAIVPLHATQIKIKKREIIKLINDGK